MYEGRQGGRNVTLHPFWAIGLTQLAMPVFVCGIALHQGNLSVFSGELLGVELK